MTDESQVQKELHERFHELMKAGVALAYIGLEDLIAEKRRHGWRSPFTRKLDNALMRTRDRIAGEFPDLEGEISQGFTLIVVLADLERYHFPRWISYLVEELVSEGVIIYDRENEKIEVRC